MFNFNNMLSGNMLSGSNQEFFKSFKKMFDNSGENPMFQLPPRRYDDFDLDNKGNKVDYDTWLSEKIQQYSKFHPDQKNFFNVEFYHLVFFWRNIKDADKKLEYLLNNIKNFEIDVNLTLPMYVDKYKSTPLHALIANEDIEGVERFIGMLEKHGIVPKYEVTDSEGKSTLLTAIKIANCPLETIKKFINKDTFNLPDNNGITPFMLAAALGRADIMAALIKCAQQEYATKELLEKKFFAMRDKEGRTVAHYALMNKEGVRDLLKSIHIDCNRDANAPSNCLTLEMHKNISLDADMPMVLSVITQAIKLSKKRLPCTRIGHGDVKQPGVDEVFLLFTKENTQFALTALEMFEKIDPTTTPSFTKGKEFLSNAIKKFTGITLVNAILGKRKPVCDLLAEHGVNFFSPDNLKKTPIQSLLTKFCSIVPTKEKLEPNFSAEEKEKITNVAKDLNMQAIGFFNNGQYEKALLLFAQAYLLAESIHDKVKIIFTVNSIGSCYQRMGKNDEAKKIFNQIIKVGGNMQEESIKNIIVNIRDKLKEGLTFCKSSVFNNANKNSSTEDINNFCKK